MTSTSAASFRSLVPTTLAIAISYTAFQIVLRLSAVVFNLGIDLPDLTELADGTISGALMRVCYFTPVTWRLLPGLAVGNSLACLFLSRSRFFGPVRWAIPIGVLLAVVPISVDMFSFVRLVPSGAGRDSLSWLWVAFFAVSLATSVLGVVIGGSLKVHMGDGPTNR